MRKLPTIEHTIESVLKAGKGYPEPEWLAKYRGISTDEAYGAMVAHRANTDWETVGLVQPAMPQPPMPEIPVDNTIGQVNTEKRVSAIHAIHNIPKDILKAVFAVLSMLCAIRSWGFIYGWFAQWDSGFFSGILACILVGTQIAVPQAVIMLGRERRAVFVSICVLVLFVSIFFSMITTIGGLYNDRSASIEAENDGSQNRIEVQLSEFSTNIKKWESERVAVQHELDLLYPNVQKYEVGSYEYNRTVNRIDSIKQQASKISQQIDKANGQKAQLIESKDYREQRTDFYSFIEQVTGNRRDEVEFIISIVVSVIVDIAGPLFATLALFL